MLPDIDPIKTILPGRSCASMCLAASRAQKLRRRERGETVQEYVS